MTPSITVATSSDAQALVNLRTNVARDMARRFGEGGWAEVPDDADVIQQVSASCVLVARNENEIVGTVRLARAKPWAIDASTFTPVTTALYVLGLAVSPHARGQGVGRRLMEAAKDTARAGEAGALWLDAYEHAAGAGPFYLKCGFRQVGRTSFREMPLAFYEWLTRSSSSCSNVSPIASAAPVPAASRDSFEG
jgi:GNAT superfamily N-acetyltransferase